LIAHNSIKNHRTVIYETDSEILLSKMMSYWFCKI